VERARAPTRWCGSTASHHTANAYTVTLDGHPVWPLVDSGFPPSVIRAIDPDAAFRLALGSCRRSDPLDDEHLAAFGPDALVAPAHQMAATSPSAWPDACS
jgi:hypothetical protein